MYQQYGTTFNVSYIQKLENNFTKKPEFTNRESFPTFSN